MTSTYALRLPVARAGAATALLAVTMSVFAQADAGLWDPGFLERRIRSDFPPLAGHGTAVSPLILAYEGPGTGGCLFDAHKAFTACPGRRDVTLPSGAPAWLGAVQVREACGGEATPFDATWLGCAVYEQANTIASNRPDRRYWVVHPNVEPSFDQCNSGPPGHSAPVALGPGGLFAIDASTPGRFALTVDNGAYDFSCFAPRRGIPFLSLGAQSNRGNVDPVGAPLDVGRFRFGNGGEGDDIDVLGFEATLQELSPFRCAPGTQWRCFQGDVGWHAGFYVLAEWDGTRKLLFLILADGGILAPPIADDIAASLWNWPVEQSMFYPGAQIGLIRAGSGITAACGLDLPRLPGGSAAQDPVRYRVEIGRLFECAVAFGLYSPPASAAQPIAVIGAHWFVETYATAGAARLTIDDPTISARTLPSP